MLTSRLRDTLAHIALKPRRIAGLSYNDFYTAQSLYMQGFVAKQFLAVRANPDGDPKREECYRISDEGREELEQYELRRSSEGVPPTKPAA